MGGRGWFFVSTSSQPTGAFNCAEAGADDVMPGLGKRAISAPLRAQRRKVQRTKTPESVVDTSIQAAIAIEHSQGRSRFFFAGSNGMEHFAIPQIRKQTQLLSGQPDDPLKDFARFAY
jgi:hypothetical protein